MFEIGVCIAVLVQNGIAALLNDSYIYRHVDLVCFIISEFLLTCVHQCSGCKIQTCSTHLIYVMLAATSMFARSDS
jgi:hypothetical protein